jgi:hypothetical protein
MYPHQRLIMRQRCMVTQTAPAALPAVNFITRYSARVM